MKRLSCYFTDGKFVWKEWADSGSWGLEKMESFSPKVFLYPQVDLTVPDSPRVFSNLSPIQISYVTFIKLGPTPRTRGGGWVLPCLS